MFPVYGFGARIPPLGAVSHNFYVTLTQSPYCFGIPGVMEAYRYDFNSLSIGGLSFLTTFLLDTFISFLIFCFVVLKLQQLY